MCHDLFSSYRGEPPMFTGLGELEKGKSVVKGLRFCYFVYILIHSTTNFSCLLSNFPRLKATILLLLIYDCI